MGIPCTPCVAFLERFANLTQLGAKKGEQTFGFVAGVVAETKTR